MPSPRLKVLALFGGVLLDFREARLLPGVTEVHVVAVMGGAQLIVPPGEDEGLLSKSSYLDGKTRGMGPCGAFERFMA
jgi:hypothetical protein